MGLTIERDPGYSQEHTAEQLSDIEAMHATLRTLHDCDGTRLTNETHQETHLHPKRNDRALQRAWAAITPERLKTAGATVRLAYTHDHTSADATVHMASIDSDSMALLRRDNRLQLPSGLDGGQFHLRQCDGTGHLVGVRWTIPVGGDGAQ
tara:strand:- start:260 stop:712 length:453 start_codon:yes stop_codon:yes gene_type:complete